MSREQFLGLKEFADRLNIDFFASPFHRDRFNWITDAGIKINKIASSMLEWDIEFCQDMVGDGMLTYCSLGKWDNQLVYPFKNSNVKYFHCVAKYPHSEKEAIELMPEKFDYVLVGYSDHSIGIDACKEAVRRGATVIEKHFTTNKKLQCKTESAHVCSMTMNDLRGLRDFCDQHQITKQ